MPRPPGSVGKHRHWAEVIFARHGKDPLEELLKLTDDSALSAERRMQLWLALVPFVYPKLRSIEIEQIEFTADDYFALPMEVHEEIARRCRKYVKEAENWPKITSRKDLPLPRNREDLKRYTETS